MDWFEIVASLVLLALSAGLVFVVRKGWIEQQLSDAVYSIAQRARDKYLAEMTAARAPSSPGGVMVTAEEASKARQMAYDQLMQILTGPARDLALRKGEAWIKGLIGRWMERD